MNVITSRPIIDGETSRVDEFSNARGKRTKRQRTGNLGKKVKEGGNRAYVRLKEAGALPVIENLLGLAPTQVQNQITDENFTPSPTEKAPMSTTTKVLIGVGIAGTIGLIWYFGFYKKNAKKA